jgi:hypothetical protein
MISPLFDSLPTQSRGENDSSEITLKRVCLCSSVVLTPNVSSQCQFSRQNGLRTDAGGGVGLDEVAHASGNFGFEQDGFAGAGGAEDFHVAHRGEFQVAQRRDGGVALGNDAGKLRGGFGEQDTGEDGLAGEMAAQEGFVATDFIFAFAALSWDEFGQLVEEAKFRAVGQEIEGALEVVRVHFVFLTVYTNNTKSTK